MRHPENCGHVADQPGKGSQFGFPANRGRKDLFTDGPDVGHSMKGYTKISLIANSHFTDVQTEAHRQEVVTQQVEGKAGSHQAHSRCCVTRSFQVHRGRMIPQENGVK